MTSPVAGTVLPGRQCHIRPPTRRHARPTHGLCRYRRPGPRYPNEGPMKISDYLGDALAFCWDRGILLFLGAVSAVVLFRHRPAIDDQETDHASGVI